MRAVRHIGEKFDTCLNRDWTGLGAIGLVLEELESSWGRWNHLGRDLTRLENDWTRLGRDSTRPGIGATIGMFLNFVPPIFG